MVIRSPPLRGATKKSRLATGINRNFRQKDRLRFLEAVFCRLNENILLRVLSNTLFKRLKVAQEPMRKLSELEKKIFDDPKLSFGERQENFHEV